MEAQLQRPEHDQYYQHYEHEPHDTIGFHSAVYDESPVIPGTNLPIQTEVNLEPPNTRQDMYNPNVMRNEDEGIMRQPSPEKMEFDFERSSVEPDFDILPDATFMEEANVAEPLVQISPLMGNLEEDPHSPNTLPARIAPSNYQSKVTDPTGHGGEEADVDPILERLDNFHIHDKSQSNPVSEQKPPQDDEIAPQSTPTVDKLAPESKISPSEIPESVESSGQAKPESMPRDTIAGKISSATSAIAGKAVSAKDMVTSRFGYGDVSSSKNPVADYGHKVAEKLAPVYYKVTGAGSHVVVERGSDRGGSVKEYLAAKLRPGDEDKALSEAITGRFYKKEQGMAPGRQQVMEAEEKSGGGGVVNLLKGAVGSWLGKSSGIGMSDGSVPVVKEETESEARVVHESGN